MFLRRLVWHVARLIRSPLPGAGAVYARRFAVLALALCVGACAGLPGSAAARSTPESFAPLVKRVLPAVVNSSVTESLGKSWAGCRRAGDTRRPGIPPRRQSPNRCAGSLHHRSAGLIVTTTGQARRQI
jgi:S1-C subfamily serine protease